jgi:Na+-transporting methylmalonyl-CoA/oxaloacetate decarboxylase gamma subunit
VAVNCSGSSGGSGGGGGGAEATFGAAAGTGNSHLQQVLLKEIQEEMVLDANSGCSSNLCRWWWRGCGELFRRCYYPVYHLIKVMVVAWISKFNYRFSCYIFRWTEEVEQEEKQLIQQEVYVYSVEQVVQVVEEQEDLVPVIYSSNSRSTIT